jgi:hypothetical protein
MTMSKAKASAVMPPLHVYEPSISRAYAQLLLKIVDNPGNEIAPLVLTVTDFDPAQEPPEDRAVRDALDTVLKQKNKISVSDVAFTIFPQRLWIMARGDRQKLFEFYKMAFPAYQAMNRRVNGRGLYFERMTMYGRGPCEGNQLEWILSQYRSGVRRSMLQATTFDPERDHTASAQLGFPCLQHVTFEPTKAGLVVNAFYATQQLFDKAYGNYLGLADLGAFMAHEIGMPLAQLNVMVGVIKLERISKTDAALEPLIAAARACLTAKPEQPQSKLAAE